MRVTNYYCTIIADDITELCKRAHSSATVVTLSRGRDVLDGQLLHRRLENRVHLHAVYAKARRALKTTTANII